MDAPDAFEPTPPAAHASQPSRVLAVEIAFDHLVVATNLTNRRAERRLNALENVLLSAVMRWRTPGPLQPARELRMSPATERAWCAWVEQGERATGTVLNRLSVYASGACADPTVPEGWVRFTLPPTTAVAIPPNVRH